MAEFKNMTVQALRDLARKALGRGHSKLKTKRELIEALQAAERKVAVAAEKAASRVKEATGRAARATGKMVESMRKEREERSHSRAKKEEQAPPAGAEQEAGGAPAGEPGKRVEGVPAKAAGDVAEAASGGVRGARLAAGGAEPEPDPESYMVARVAGEQALRGAPHAMTEGDVERERRARRAPPQWPEPPSAYDEHLGELPWSYGDDAFVALPRDPRTLFLYWDHGQETLRRAWEGLDGGRAQIWLFLREPDGRWTRIRAIDFALESRSYYVHDLEPGRVYRAEIHVVDIHGREKLLPRPSNEMMLPPIGPSPIVDDRFMRILWSDPLQRLLRETHGGAAFPDDVRAQLARLSDWSRFAGRGAVSSAGGVGGRPSSASSPSSPWGGRPSGGER